MKQFREFRPLGHRSEGAPFWYVILLLPVLIPFLLDAYIVYAASFPVWWFNRWRLRRLCR